MSGSPPQTVDRRVWLDDETKQKIAGSAILVGMLIFVPWALIKLLPGLIVTICGIALISPREKASRWAWIAVALLVASYAAPLSLQMQNAALGKQGAGVQSNEVMQEQERRIPPPRSGEEVLMSDGEFMRVADPDDLEGGATEGWQKRLFTTMTTAIQNSQEQVVMVFSREGCPWCDEQLPVLRKAIQSRAGMLNANAEDEQESTVEPAVAFVGGHAAVGMDTEPEPLQPAANLLEAPLRVFIFYAEEFPRLAEAFGIQAFLTTIAGGRAGVTPIAAQGFLDDERFEELLQTIATAQADEKKKKTQRPVQVIAVAGS